MRSRSPRPENLEGRAYRSLGAALGLLALAACAGRGLDAVPDIQGVDKPAMRRGVRLAEEIDRFLADGFVLLAQRGYQVDNFAEAAGDAKGDARRIGGQLIVLYENLDPAIAHDVAVPAFIPESYFQASGMRQVLDSVAQARVVAFFWARPNRPMALGAYFYAKPPARALAASGAPDAPSGVQIQAIVRRSPAALGYLLKDDWITHLDGHAVRGDADELVAQLTAKRGQTVELTVIRDGDPQVKRVTLNP